MDSETNETRYLICPVCHQTNPAGTKFCEHCWGAALNQDETYSESELKEARQRREALLKRKKITKLSIWGGIGGVFVVLLILFLLNYTDVFGTPGETLNSDSQPGEWAMFRHDVLRSGSAGDETVIPEGTLKWAFTTGELVHSSPAVAGDMVYCGSQDHFLYALDKETGEPVWTFETGSFVDSSPAVSGGKVYVGSNDSNFYALDALTGETVWEYETKYSIRSDPAVAGDKVYFGSDDYFLYALDAETGKRVWRFNTKSPAGTAPVIESGIVHYGASGGYSYAVDAESGLARLRYKSGFTVYSSAVVDNGTMYLATTHGLIIAVDQMARTWLWEHDIRPYWSQAWAMLPWLPQPPEQSGKLWTKLLYANTSTPCIENGVMYIGSGKFIVALDLESREILWQYETGDIVRSSPSVAGPVVYAGSDDGALYAVDASTGELRWKYQTGSRVTSSPAVVDGVVYVGSEDGKIYAIE
jgi:outer membrane protein assembly factor BamB